MDNTTRDSTEQIAPMPPEAFHRLNRRSFTITISADSLIRYGLLLGGYICLAAGYVLIGVADARRQEK